MTVLELPPTTFLFVSLFFLSFCPHVLSLFFLLLSDCHSLSFMFASSFPFSVFLSVFFLCNVPSLSNLPRFLWFLPITCKKLSLHYACVYVYMCVHTHVRVCMCLYVCTYIRTRTYVRYACMCSLRIKYLKKPFPFQLLYPVWFGIPALSKPWGTSKYAFWNPAGCCQSDINLLSPAKYDAFTKFW